MLCSYSWPTRKQSPPPPPFSEWTGPVQEREARAAGSDTEKTVRGAVGVCVFSVHRASKINN